MIDRSSWHKLLTFIYAYAGLNQIKMKEEVDEEKITSINEQGSYCFKAISFGLRNLYMCYIPKIYGQKF